MGMDTHSILCTRAARCGSNDHFGHNVEKIRHQQYRVSFLYRLAQPALGYQASMEPFH